MSENDTRARLVDIIKEGNNGGWAPGIADAILRECEVKFREPEVDPRDLAAAKEMHERAGRRVFGAWEECSQVCHSWFIAEARRERLALDAAHDAGVAIRDAAAKLVRS